MKKHINKLFASILALLLLTTALGTRLAQPEANSTANDKFIGFFLSYEKMPPDMAEIEANPEEYVEDRSHWVEYGSDTLQLDGIGKVAFPRMILIGEKVGSRYEFPDLEGYNCFLAIYTDEYGSECYGGYTDMADCKIHIGGGTVGHSLSGTVYFGPPLDDRNWNTENFDYCWTAYRVYQMEDGTVYLDGSGNSYGGVGGFSFSEKSEYTTTVNGESTTESLEISVTINSIPRLETVTIQQYDNHDQLLRTDTITDAQAKAQNGETLELLLEANTAYAIVAETDVDGNINRSLQEVSVSENRRIYFTSWFLNEKGMGYCLPVDLSPEPEGGQAKTYA